jgi:hypothetical protein
MPSVPRDLGADRGDHRRQHLAGAPRKPVAWVIIGLFLALRILLAITGALFSPGVEVNPRAG